MNQPIESEALCIKYTMQELSSAADIELCLLSVHF